MRICQKNFIAALMALLSFQLVAVPPASDFGSHDDPVRSGCEPDYPPFCIVTEQGLADGFATELLRAALKTMGRSVVFETNTWARLRYGLEQGRLQALPLVGRTPARERIYDFTFPYLTLHGTIVVRADNTDIRNPNDLIGRKVAVLQGDNAEEYLRQHVPGAHIVPLPSSNTALRELSSGKHDAVVIQKLLALQLIQQNGLRNLVIVGPPLKDFAQTFCFATRKGDDALLAVLNEGLALTMSDGTFRTLYAKWFGPIGTLDRIKSRIVVGGDASYPPYEFLDDNGQPSGFNVDLTRAIARHMGLSVDVRLGTWNRIRQGLKTGEVDAVQGMFYSSDRDTDFDFTPPSTLIQHVIVVRRGTPRPTDMKDVADKPLIVMKGDIMDDLATSLGYTNQIVRTDSGEEALRLLASGQGFCVLIARIPALYWIRKNGWHNLRIGSVPIASPEYCYAMPHGHDSLLAAFSEGLAALKSTGEYRRIQTKWLGPYETTPSYRTLARYILIPVIPLLALAGGFALWSRSLQKQVGTRTRELAFNNALLMAQSDASLDGILAVDTGGRTLSHNAQLFRLWNLSPDSGPDILTAIAERLREPTIFQALIRRLKTDPHGTSRDELQLQDGRTLESYTAPVADNNGNDYGRVWYFRDITEIKQAACTLETSAAQTQRMLDETEQARRALLSVIEDQKKAEEELRTSEERFHSLYNAMSEGVALHELTYDSTGKPINYVLLGVNPAFETILGLKAGDVVGKTATEAYGTPSPPYLDAYARVAETGQPVRFEATPESIGRTFTISAVSPAKGQFATVFDDITERKKAEQTLRESETRFRSLIEAAPDAIFVQSKGFFVYLNRAAITLFGAVHENQLLGTAILDRIAPEYRDLVRDRIRIQLETGQRVPLVEQDDVRLDGSRVPVETTAMPILFQGKPSSLVFLRDITARKQAQAERERLLAAIDQSSETIVITDTQGTILYTNPAFETITGYTRKEALGLNPRILKSGKHDATFYENLWKTLRSGETWRGQFVNKRKNGSLFTEAASISPVRNAAGDITNFVAVKRDITEHLQLSDQLAQAQKMESIGRLAGGVAHDFNNMLGVILGNVELAMDATAPLAPIFADLEEIKKAAERSADLTRQLLAFARKQTVTPKMLDLNDTVAAMLKMLRRLIGEQIELVWRPCAQETTVWIDPSQLDQILANLAVNARDAIAGVGQVAIETSVTTLTTADCSGNTDIQPGDYVTLTVEDDGCGMDADVLEHLFEPFFTTKKVGEGTGLGLATVYGIVRQNGGLIAVHSQLQKGTIFTICLPLQPSPAEADHESDLPEEPSRSHETVLLVEDEPAILTLGKRKLENLGYRVLVAKTPEEALTLAEAECGTINLLVTDVIMPQMTGWELATRLQKKAPLLKFVFMSGYTSEAASSTGRPFPEARFIQKPFNLKALAHAVAETLRRPPPQS